jgi:hypothetical protein
MNEDPPQENIDRDEWFKSNLDSSWIHLTCGDSTSGPTSSFVDIFFRREDDGSCTLRFFGEPLESDEPPLELESESYDDLSDLSASLNERGFAFDEDDLFGSTLE